MTVLHMRVARVVSVLIWQMRWRDEEGCAPVGKVSLKLSPQLSA
jgi:hypothetical protein